MYKRPYMFINNYRQINTGQGWRRRTRVQEERVAPLSLAKQLGATQRSPDSLSITPAGPKDAPGHLPAALRGQDSAASEERQGSLTGRRGGAVQVDKGQGQREGGVKDRCEDK